jgi:hypothetical protein
MRVDDLNGPASGQVCGPEAKVFCGLIGSIWPYWIGRARFHASAIVFFMDEDQHDVLTRFQPFQFYAYFTGG